jgi:hypothetical protein
MDLEIFDDMENCDLRNYIKFLLWHYRVIDAFWYINVTGRQGFIKAIQYWRKRS